MTARKIAAVEPIPLPEEDNVLAVDPNMFTGREIQLIEETSGMPITTLNDATKPQGKITCAVAWVMARRTNPKITLEEASDLVVLWRIGDVPPTK